MFHHNHGSLALFGLFLQEMQAKIAAKTAQKVQVKYGYVETKRESVARNSNRDIFLNCVYYLVFYMNFRNSRPRLDFHDFTDTL